MTHVFEIGDEVTVEPMSDDTFTHEFVGVVAGFRHDFIVVNDGDADSYDVCPEQLELYDSGCSNPELVVAVKRKVLWSVWSVLMGVDFERRDVTWQCAARNVKRLLNESR